MAVRAGQAFIMVGPSFRGFKAKTETWVKSNLRAIEVPIEPKVSKKPIMMPPVKPVKAKVEVDRSAFNRSISAVESRLDRLSRGRFLINVGIALSPIAAPALAAAVGGAVAGGGIGAAGLAGIVGVSAVGAASLKRLSEAQDTVTTTTKARTLAVKSLQGAEQSFASAQRSAAAARVSAARQVANAERSVGDAQARLRDSQDAVRASLDDLHLARRQAVRDLEDLREKTRDNDLTTEAASIGLVDAQAELTRIQADASSTALDLRKAKLGVAEAEDRLSDARRQGADDAKELRKAERGGTSGNAGVEDARKAVEDAKKDRADAAEGVRRARQDLAEARSDAARQIADANASVAAAGADLATAQMAASDAQAAQAKALAALSPAQKAAADGIDRLKRSWGGFQDTTDPVVLGALVMGMDALGKVLVPLALFLTPVAKAAGLMFTVFGDAAATKGFQTWSREFGIFTAGITSDATQGILNLGRAFGSLLTAFMPLSNDMSGGLVVLTDRFATWTAGLEGSSGFQSFTDYVRENGPLVLSTLGDLGLAFIEIGKAAAPLGHTLLIVIGTVAQWTAGFAAAHPQITSMIVAVIALSSGVAALAVPTARLVSLFKIFISPLVALRRAWLLHTAAVNAGTAASIRSRIANALITAGMIVQRGVTLAVAGATRVWAAGQWLLNAALTANPIGLVIVGLFAFGALVVTLYKKVGWFRKGVDALWYGLKVGFGWVKDHWPLLLVILTGPIGLAIVLITKNFSKIRSGFGNVVDAFRTGKDKIVSIWGRISDAVTSPLTTIKKALNVFFSGIDKIAEFFGLNFNFRFDVSAPKKQKKVPSGDDHRTDVSRAKGGVLPGWSPGRDIHTFVSPTGGKLHLSGGESVMVPEWTAAVGGEKAVQSMNAAARNGQAFAKGGVVWPTLSKHWTTYAGHDGLDFNGAKNDLGDPYFASKAGKVAYTGFGRGYGHAVFLDTDGGPTLTYGHSSRVDVRAGQRVQAGQRMGLIGYTGNVRPAGRRGSHLHFGLVGEGPDQGIAALNFLTGARLPSGKGGGGSDFNPIGKIKSLIKQTERMANKLDDGPFGSMLKKTPGTIGGFALDWAKKKANPLDDIADAINPFDRGGLATSHGLMVKNTLRPERVLSPRQTAVFEKAMAGGGLQGPLEIFGDLELTSESGVTIRGIAKSVVDQDNYEFNRDLR